MTQENGVQGLLDRISFRPSKPALPPLDLGEPLATSPDAAAAPPRDSVAALDPLTTSEILPSLTFRPPADLGPPVPDNTPIAATRPADVVPVTPPAAAPAAVRPAGAYHDGAFTGVMADAYFGVVQVRAHVNGGKLTGIDVLSYPSDRRTSRSINNYALPVLEREVVVAQNAHVHIVSGATLTAAAYITSLDSALKQAQ
jgi:uncharacterized protein with FMN-binding domain